MHQIVSQRKCLVRLLLDRGVICWSVFVWYQLFLSDYAIGWFLWGATPPTPRHRLRPLDPERGERMASRPTMLSLGGARTSGVFVNRVAPIDKRLCRAHEETPHHEGKTAWASGHNSAGVNFDATHREKKSDAQDPDRDR